MKKILIHTLIIFCILKVSSQESLYLLKKDTIFITYDFNLKNEKVIKKYKSIETKKNKKKGIRAVYNFLDSIRLKRKEKIKKMIKENRNKGHGSIGGLSNHFGLYFIYNSIKKENIDSTFKKSFLYDFINKTSFKKDTITLKDSISYDVKIFSHFKNKKTLSTLIFNENELENKTIFKFDGSTKKYKELLKLSKEPYYFFVLDKKYSEEKYMQIDKKKYGMVKTDYYLFNEVFFPSSIEVRMYIK